MMLGSKGILPPMIPDCFVLCPDIIIYRASHQRKRVRMTTEKFFSKIGHKIHNWFTLGLEGDQLSAYNALSDYRISLAKDNLTMLKSCCLVSYFLLFSIMLAKCITGGISLTNTIPFFTGAVLFSIILLIMKRDTAQTGTIRLSYFLTSIFKITWYALSFFFDIIVQPDMPNVMSCLAFVLLTSLFNERPRNNIAEALAAYIVMMVLDTIKISPELMRSDALNVLVSMIIGIFLSQRSTKTNVSRKLYMDMYKTATKTSIIVAQINIISGTFEILQWPEYMSEVIANEITAQEGIDMIGKRFVSPEFSEEFMKQMDFETMTQKLDNSRQLNFYFLDFRQKWCQLVIVPQKFTNHKVSAVVAIVRDVDLERRKEIEYQRQLNEAVREASLASASKTSFLRRMSHDIRTPINGIRGMLEISEHYADDKEKQAECRKKMWEASGYLLALVNDVLDMNKLESGTITLDNEPFSLTYTLNEIKTVSEMQAQGNGVSFHLNISPELKHEYLIGSSTHLKRILQNLTGNAVKYNHANGSVTLNCEELHSDDVTATFRFICSDTGIGMSEEFQKNAFEPFAQEGRLSNMTFMGTGLGLSIVKELVEKMGGTIELKSVINIGSTFTVIIPFKIDHSPVNKVIQTGQTVDTSGKKVLLVEDNELNAEIAVFILESRGLVVERAANGREAVDIFSASQPFEYAIIFMDIMMPVMSGLDATRAIRKLSRADAVSTPIIAMSANAFHDDIQNSLDAGMNGHLRKPLEHEKIDEVIRNILGTR